MKVSDAMVTNVQTCGPNTSLDAAAMMMWDNDCGSIVVTDDNNLPIGIITDRDITMSSALNHKALWELTTRETLNNRPLFTCHDTDDIKMALNTMKQHKVRRLPVLDRSEQHITGFLSIDDVVSCARKSKNSHPADLSYEEAITTLKAVCKHH